MKVSILIPVYNEIDTLPIIIEKTKNIPIQKEILIIDDGSNDGTEKILKNLKNENIKTIFHEKNRGKGSAIKTGLKYSTGDIIVIQDADLEYEPSLIPNLTKFIIDGTADVVFGSRFLQKNPNIYKIYLLGNFFLTFLINLLYGTKYTDTYTGYKVFRRDVIEKLSLKSKRFEVEAEICVKLARLNVRFLEVPITYVPRTIAEGKKIKLKDAFIGIFTIFRYFFFRLK